MKTVHFISGLPRAGSTLLSGLLKQNPRFHAGMSSPVAGLVTDMLGGMSAANEYSVFISDEQRTRLLRGVIENYYGEEFAADVVFDTNRAWNSRLSLLKILYPNSKVIACVRDVPWIIDSFEQLIQKNALSPSSLVGYKPGTTVYHRADTISNGDGVLGYAYNALKEAFFGPNASQLMLVQYETLVHQPLRVLDAIYQFIGEPSFAHDPMNISFEADEFDRKAGTPGLHAVRRQVEVKTRKTILPPDIYHRFERDAFWRDPALNVNQVQIV